MATLVEIAVVCRHCGEETVVWEEGQGPVEAGYADYCSDECEEAGGS
jgi:hypothetical protein